MTLHADDPKLTAYALGELSGEEREQVRREVDASPELTREVEQIRAAAGTLQAELAKEPTPAAKPEVLALAKAPADAVKPARRKSWLRFALPAAATAMAAVLVAGFFMPSLNNEQVLAFKKCQNVLHNTGDARSNYALDNSRLSDKERSVTGLQFMLVRDGQGVSSFTCRDDFDFDSLQGEEVHGNFNTESYDHVVFNAFQAVTQEPLSTFSIDVDTASYSNVRRFLRSGQLPPKGAVRVEEMINYFRYDYPQPEAGQPFSVNVEIADCPWQRQHKLIRIGLKGREIAVDKRPPCNLVFLLDVSGSMSDANKLSLVKESMKMLVDKLNENDRVAIVTYAGSSGVHMQSTRCDHKEEILAAIDRLQAGGCTNGGSGIKLAYEQATDVSNFLKQGVNRVILCTDGDFNVGVTNQSELIDMIQDKAKSGVFLSVMGFGMGNYKDSTLVKLADKGNGNYAYIDTATEAKKHLVDQMSGTLVTIAKDVKIQIEFNPAKICAYRLIGYEKRMLRKEDFNDDKKDAGEIGAGHTVTAIYQVVPVGVKLEMPGVDPLKYQKLPAQPAGNSDEWLTVKLRHKQPDGETSKLTEFPIRGQSQSLAKASADMQFAAAVASFGMQLQDCQYKGDYTLDAVLELAKSGLSNDKEGYRAEFVELIRLAKGLKKP